MLLNKCSTLGGRHRQRCTGKGTASSRADCRPGNVGFSRWGLALDFALRKRWRDRLEKRQKLTAAAKAVVCFRIKIGTSELVPFPA